ncbi:protein kinase [Pseudarthrobacter sp. NPDC089323]
MPEQSTTGQLLGGRYRLQELVGRGAAAGVYRSFDEFLGREVAVKIFVKEAGEPELLARQEAEIRILASLIHPGLVTLFDAGTDAAMERSFVVMEYVSGPDLRQFLREEPMEAASIASMGSDLAFALDYVHGRGVIHRDIKPGNVLLYKQRPSEPDSPWRAKLADFGIARVMEEEHLTGTGRTVGTAAYLSPEQALGESVGGASDVYSLGLVLLECFTRHVEFPGSQIESGVARLNRDAVIPDDIGPEWKALLAAMTARTPADRPTAAEAAAVLRQLAVKPSLPAVAATPAGAVQVLSPVPGPQPDLPPHLPKAVRPRRRILGRRARATAGACAAAVILGVATTATFGGAGSNQPLEQTEPAAPIQPVHNNPVDFHLDQLEAALAPSAVSREALSQLVQAVLTNDLEAAVRHLDRLERDVADEAAAGGLTFAQYKGITTAIRMVRLDLDTIAAATGGSTAEAVPAGADSSSLNSPDAVPIAEPLPVIIEPQTPAAEYADDNSADQQEEQPATDADNNAGSSHVVKAKDGKPSNPGKGNGD